MSSPGLGVPSPESGFPARARQGGASRPRGAGGGPALPSRGLSPPDGEVPGQGSESLPGSRLPLPPAAPEEERGPLPHGWQGRGMEGLPRSQTLPKVLEACGGSVVTGSDAGTLGDSRGPPSCGDGRLPHARCPWFLLQSDAPRHPCPLHCQGPWAHGVLRGGSPGLGLLEGQLLQNLPVMGPGAPAACP